MRLEGDPHPLNLTEILNNLDQVAPGHCDEDGNLDPQYLEQDMINKLGIVDGFMKFLKFGNVGKATQVRFIRQASWILRCLYEDYISELETVVTNHPDFDKYQRYFVSKNRGKTHSSQ